MRLSLRLLPLAAAIACTPPSTPPASAPSPAAAVSAARTSIDSARTTASTTWPSFSATATLSADQQRWIDSTLASLSLRQRVGQMVMVWVLGDYTSNTDSTFAEVRRWIDRDGIGGVSMSLGTPIEVAAKVNAMQRLARVPLIVSADLEPGLGRLEGGVFSHYLMDAGSATVFPSNMAIAATGREQDAYDVARVIAREARAVGIQIDFAPVVDVNNNPNNPVINTRSFGEDPQRVARLSAQFVRGLQENGAIATAKHFPGHGDTDVDSHVGLPRVPSSRARLDSVELVPFRAAIQAGAGLVMTAHIALPALGDSATPATLSPGIITGLLRDTLGFGGVTITDAMTMEGVGKGYSTEQSSVLAVRAGSDILLKPSDPTRAIDAVVAAVERGEITRARIDSAVRHVLELKVRTGVASQPIADVYGLREIVGTAEHRALAADIAQRAVTLLRDRENLLPQRSGRVLVVQYAPETELKAGRVFGPTLRAALSGSRVVKITPSVSRPQLDSIANLAQGADRIVVAAYVRRIEGEGRFAMPQHVASWIDSLAQRPTGPKVAVVAYGNPYLIRQFPRVGTYLVTYGVSDDLERAAANALLGRAPITGRAPISLPGFFQAGDGIQRSGAGSP